MGLLDEKRAREFTHAPPPTFSKGAQGLLGYVDDVVHGRVAKKAITGLLGALESGDPEKIMDYIGPGAVAGVTRKVGGLAMDEASRLARAKGMGFDISSPIYHETAASNVPLIMRDGFNINSVGARASDHEMPNGVFTKPHDRGIGLGGEVPEQIPMYGRPGNQFPVSDRNSFIWQMGVYNPRIAEIADEVAKIDKATVKKIDELMALQDEVYKRAGRGGTKDPEYMRLSQEIDDLFASSNEQTKALAAESRELINQVLKSQGYDSVRMRSDAGAFGRKVDTTVFLDPSQLRHVDAAFDPAKKDSADLLAGIAPYAIPVGLAGLLGYQGD